MAATDPEAARMAAKMHSGSFPLDATINQFQPVAPAPILTAPPDPGRIATNAADLPATPRPAGTAVPASVHPRSALPWSVTWADAGLLGLLACGAWFCWRTRRESAPVG